MTTLKLDPAALEAAAQDLQVIADEFTAADANGEAAAAAAGDPDLAETLRSFSTSWSDARTDMLGSIGALAQACRDIGTTFAEIDAQLAAALR